MAYNLSSVRKGAIFSLITSHAYENLGEESKLMITHLLTAVVFLSALGLHLGWQKCCYLEVLGFSKLALKCHC